tara:strand:- start:294 stop:506 length:213 start_codon:yes stop_codon:yes gene_type:complete
LERNRIGFHQVQVHPYLSQYSGLLINERDSHVFVPFSSKSSDMLWLAQYMKVSGSELSAIAYQDFLDAKI